MEARRMPPGEFFVFADCEYKERVSMMPDPSRPDLAGGIRLARILRGAWRKTPPPPDFSDDELGATLAVLDRSHLNGIAWWRVRRTPLAGAGRAITLRQKYVNQALLAAEGTHRVFRFVSALRDHGIEPIVFKGWSLVPYYAEPGLRSVGDVDLAVDPREAERATGILKGLGALPTQVDVHPGLSDSAHAAFIPDSNWQDLLTNSRTRTIGGLDIRVLSAEDELQVVCIHCMRHLAARPMWLCDIAAAVEAHPAAMHWERCLSKPPYRSWILYAVLLAHHLLGAELQDTPFAAHAGELPAWLVRDVLRRWSLPPVPSIAVHDSILKLWREPGRWGEAVGVRLPNKLATTLAYRGSLDDRFLARYQARAIWENMARFAWRNIARE